jgi:SPP1 gp7 family putative phage head morphogenesis protein
MRFDISRAVKVGVSLGETNAQIAKRIFGEGGEKGGEVMPRGRRDAMSITRTAVQTVANNARMATYLENADIIKAVQWISTLDSRTTLICMARSGKTWSLPDFKPIGHEIPWDGGPPAHWACRSTTIPITKSFEELGGDGPDLSASTRSSMDGQAAADLTFDAFLKSKPASFADEMLGVGRAQLWRAGKITLSDLLDARGVPLTLAELRAQYGTAK